MSPYIRSPMRGSVGRLKRGMALFTGWSENASSIDDWDKGEANACIAPCFENWMANNTEDNWWDRFKDELKRVEVPLKLYSAEESRRAHAERSRQGVAGNESVNSGTAPELTNEEGADGEEQEHEDEAIGFESFMPGVELGDLEMDEAELEEHNVGAHE